MRRTTLMLWISLGVLMLAACRRQEHSITGSYGDGVISGQVVMAASMANTSPAGVQVTVVGTGMTTTLSEDGKFAFANVPEDARLHFTRGDGIDATLKMAGTGSAVIELSATSASAARRRAAPPPLLQLEGIIKTASATEIVIDDASRGETTVKLTDTTVIRHGNDTFTADQLKAGWQVHVKAMQSGDDKVAVEIMVQRMGEDEGDDDGDGDPSTATANGYVTSLGADEMVVHRPNGTDVTVKVTATTEIKEYGQPITFADIKVGAHVECRGKRIDDHTIEAVQIEVEENGHNPDDGPPITVNGSVKSVGASQLTVTAQQGGDVVVKTDASTRIRKQGKTISLSDVKAGDRVTAHGTRVDATTILATEIEVKGGKGKD